MPKLTSACLCFLALISATATCVGQQSTPPVPPSGETVYGPQIRVDYVRALNPVIKIVGEAQLIYLRDTGRRRGHVNLPKVTGARGHWIDMTADFSLEPNAVRPVWFNLEFKGDRESFGSGAGRAVVIVADGQRFDFGEAREVKPQQKDASQLALKKSIAYESFVRALGGENVEIHLGSTVFTLGEAQRRAVRDLIKLSGAEAP